MRTFLLLALLAAACNRGPEVPTAAENRDLDNAADMLNEVDGSLPIIDENAVDPPTADNAG